MTETAAATLTDDELVSEIKRRMHARMEISDDPTPEALGLRIVEAVNGYVSGLHDAGADVPLISRSVQPDA